MIFAGVFIGQLSIESEYELVRAQTQAIFAVSCQYVNHNVRLFLEEMRTALEHYEKSGMDVETLGKVKAEGWGAIFLGFDFLFDEKAPDGANYELT